MRTRTLLLFLIIVLIAGFAVINWSTFTASTTLSLGVTTFEAPLGLVMLGLIVVLTLTFAVYMAVWQGSVLLETRRHTKELQAQRALADQAEASRFTELRGVLLAEFAKLAEHVSASQSAMQAEMRENTNSLAAMLGEIEDRLPQRAAGV